MKQSKMKLWVVALGLALSGVANAATITVDGDPSDWGSIPYAAQNPSALGDQPIGIKLTNDANNLYFLLTFASPIVLTNISGDINLDSDKNVTTGGCTFKPGIDYTIAISTFFSSGGTPFLVVGGGTWITSGIPPALVSCTQITSDIGLVRANGTIVEGSIPLTGLKAVTPGLTGFNFNVEISLTGAYTLTAAAPPPTPSVRQEQLRPAIQALLSILGSFTVSTPITKRNAVVLTHGWNSNANEWPLGMATRIRGIIDGRQLQGFFPNEQWDVYYVDWREAADTYFSWNAYTNAESIGKELAVRLNPQQYDHIHFIAHSAGSKVIETASYELKLATIKQPFIHETFLDAYHPDGNITMYGENARWAEQYVDTRDSETNSSLKNTNLILSNAFNFIVDALDVPALTGTSTCTDVICAHAWPYVWYGVTVVNPTGWNYGIRLATEYSTIAPPGNGILADSGECKLTSATTTCPDELVARRSEIQSLPVINSWGSADGLTINKSDTGSVAITSLQGLHLTLTTGSPVWVSLASNVPQAFNTLQFDYKFTSRAEGLLSVFLDDQVVFKADELQAQAGVNSSGLIAVGNVTPGQHTLSFRLDHFTNTQSSVEISNISPSNSSIIRVLNQKPIASAGTNQIVRLGSLVHLDGSGSNDPDQKPLPLTFNWTQTSGPTTLLFDSATARPKFTPLTKGTYVFSLLVNDGRSNSDPARVTVTVPMLGDIDLDGDVDYLDLLRIVPALGKATSGPNDLRDINGDAKIDYQDLVALSKLCTRRLCAAK